ncbi:MazG-like domain [Syntrophomonas zehnderi OL-4]|uniref:MazG-like domain n=1 Tax=Syntrophomonas zehnderi OL-4 TaxID=690567 RepID=A0A0E3W2H1_9FIRM|nr:MazG-like family protein [Syntrophomonas zehnderi]CFW99923.1 MazG-like domain [Syntrophomonas zehnderi OL-4]
MNIRNKNKDLDIATNLKVIEWLKAELVESVGALLKSLLKAGNDATSDALATIIIVCYILGKRVGISFQAIDMRIRHKINTSINDAHEIEQWYGDLSDLQKYLDKKDNKKR